MNHPPYSYRTDPDVPDFDDSRPLFVFDNVCVLCSSGVRFLMKHDSEGRINYTSAQDALGQALYRHYRIDMDATYLLIADGEAWSESAGYFKLAEKLGGWWRLALIGRIVPRGLADAAYRLVAHNRYRWFGKTKTACELLTEEQQSRLV